MSHEMDVIRPDSEALSVEKLQRLDCTPTAEPTCLVTHRIPAEHDGTLYCILDLGFLGLAPLLESCDKAPGKLIL